MPCTGRCPARSGPSGRGSTAAPIAVSSSRSWSTGWVAAARPARQRHRAAGDQRGGEERRGAGEVGLDRPSARPRSGPGSTAQTSGHAVVHRRPRPRAASAPSSAGAARTAPAGRRAGPPALGRTAAPASSRPETSWLEAEASMTDLAAGDPPGAVHGQRQAAGRRRRRSARRASAARRPAGASGRCRACGSPSKVTVPVGQRRRPAAGTASPCRPGPTSTWAGPRSGRGPDHPALVVAVSRRATPIARSAGRHQLGVAGAQWARAASTGRRPARLSTRARAVIDLEPGSRTVAVDRAGGGRRGPGLRRRVGGQRCPRSHSADAGVRRSPSALVSRSAGQPARCGGVSVWRHVRPVRDDPQRAPT